MMKLLSYEETSEVIKNLKNSSYCNRNYMLLWKSIMETIWENQINHQVLFSVAVIPEEVDNMIFENLYTSLASSIKSSISANYIKVDRCGDIVESKHLEGRSSEIKKKLADLSVKEYVFFFGENGITRFCNGNVVDDDNVFYSREDRLKYREKKDISQLQSVIGNYATQYLTQQVNYMTLFADNSTLNQIDKKLTKRNILRNKPEHYMRDQLCQYLTENMRYTFTIEPELGQSKGELDVYFDVSGELYFIEIKWLGTSINVDGTGLSTTYSDARARKGVLQTLEYIKELLNSSEKSLRQGYLLIYDARDKKNKIDFQEYRFVTEELKEYLSCFSLLDILPLEKRHSA